MTGERPKRGLGGLGAIRDMAQQGDPARPEVLPDPDPPRRPRPAPRGTFSTRLRPELHHHLKQQVLALGWALGKPVSMEDVLEAIMTEYQQDEALRERVRRRIEEG